MGKVSIKKNVKPKTIKQKQKQTQKTNVTVNIGSISKKRGRPKRQSHIEKKKPTQQPIYQPIVSNQPIFKQTNPQPQSLASSILATQEKPKIVSNEIKQESAITRALVEQSTNTNDPQNLVNDLEKTKKKVIIPTPVKPPTITPIPVKPSFIIPSQTTETNSIRRSLLSQSLNDQGNDTEEIQKIKAGETKKISTLPLYPLAAAGRLGIEATSVLNMGAGVASSALPYVATGGIVLGSLGLGVASLAGSGLYSGAKSLLSSRTNEQNPLTGSYQQPLDDETKEETFLEETKDEENIPSEPEPDQPLPTILEPIQPPTILEPVQPPPTILEPVQPPPTILEPVPPPPILEPENQIVLRKPQKVGQTSTATEEINIRNPIDGSTPSFLKSLNSTLPSIYLEDIVGQKEPLSFSEKLKQKRNKEPLLAIEPQTAQGEAEDTIKMLENLLNPNKKVSTTPFNNEEFEAYKSYTKQVGQAEKAAEEGGVTNLDKQKTPEYYLFEQKLDSMTNLQLGKLLKDNKLKAQSGNDFRLTTNKQVYDGKQFIPNTQLKQNLLTAFEFGYLTNLEEN
jgi:hypothetical protein